MGIGLLGRKLGMTQLFTEHGEVIPITVMELVHAAFTVKDAREGRL